MRVLVTGGAGFIGSFVVDGLRERGHEARVLDTMDPQVHGPDGGRHRRSAAELIVGDVRDRSVCARALGGVDAVVHAAAAVGVGQSLYRIEHYVDVNVRGTATLLECLVEQSPRPRKLVILTSMTAYGEGVYRRLSDGARIRVDLRTPEQIDERGWNPVCPETGAPLHPVPTPEDAALQARNVYALTKRYQEELALNVGRAYGVAVVGLRLFNVYGPGQSLGNPYTGVLAIFTSRLLAGEPPVVYEDGGQTRDFVAVRDVASGVLAALESEAADGQVVNIGSGVGRGIGDVATQLGHLVTGGRIAPRITGEFRHGDVRHCTADPRLAGRLLGWAPRTSWESGLAELVDWARASESADGFRRADGELRARGLVSSGRRRGPEMGA